MIRTQVQIPDELYRQAKQVARRREISLAELVRRGLEYMIAVTPQPDGDPAGWDLPKPEELGASDPFADPNWRVRLHASDDAMVADEGEPYDGDTPK